MGWIKTIGRWIGGRISNFAFAAAQKEKYETQIMILNAEHKKLLEMLEAENRDLRGKVEPLTQQLKQCQAALSFLQRQLQQHEEAERRDPPIPGADAGF